MLALACSVLTIPSNPHGNWSLLMKHADILKAWKVKTVAFCLFPLWAWLSLRNRFSRWIAGHRASPCGVRDAKLGFYLPLGANNHSGFPLLRFGVGVGSDRSQGLWLGLSVRAFLWPHVEPGSSHSTVPHDGGHFLKKKSLELISWYPCLFRLGSGLLLTFTSNTIVKGSENPQRDLSEGLLCLWGAIIYVLWGLTRWKCVFTSIPALALGRI